MEARTTDRGIAAAGCLQSDRPCDDWAVHEDHGRHLRRRRRRRLRGRRGGTRGSVCFTSIAA